MFRHLKQLKLNKQATPTWMGSIKQHWLNLINKEQAKHNRTQNKTRQS